MALKLSSIDIIWGVQFAKEIYERGFSAEHAADARYEGFQNDILSFSNLLRTLNQALQDAEQRYRERRPLQHSHHPLSEAFENERKAFIGDFRETLQDCNDLLVQNKLVRSQQSSVLGNLKWHLSQQEPRVDDLRRRLHFHTQKVRIVCDRLTIGLLTDQDSRLDNVLEISDQNLAAAKDVMHEVQQIRLTLFGNVARSGTLDQPARDDIHIAGRTIIQKFDEQLLVNSPPVFEDSIPLPEAFDALLEHFEKSFEGLGQTPEKYLDLLKTRWLLARIKSSQDFQAARPGFYFKRAVNQIEQAILVRIQQHGELRSYNEDVLTDLPDSCFHVWYPSRLAIKELPHRPQPLMLRAGEEEVAYIELATDATTDTDSVTIFKLADDSFRVVRETTHRPKSKIVEHFAHTIVTQEDRLIPRYALPRLIDPPLEISVFSRGEEILYRFNSFNELQTFQSALMGYHVSYDHDSDITCQFSSNLKSLDCAGHVQLWQEPNDLPTPHAGVTPSRPESLRTVGLYSQGTLSHEDTMMPSMASSTVVNRTSAGREAKEIKMPAIVIFTQVKAKREKKDRFAIIFIELGRGSFVDLQQCNCHRDYDHCSKLILASRTGSSFTVRAFFSDIEDPNAFDIFQFRIPRHPNFHSLFREKTKYFLLKFSNLQQKKQFHENLNLMINVLDMQVNEQRSFASQMRYLMDMPKRISSGSASRVSTGKTTFDDGAEGDDASALQVSFPKSRWGSSRNSNAGSSLNKTKQSEEKQVEWRGPHPISVLVRRCVESFEKVAQNEIKHQDVMVDELGRFRVWAGSLSAHQDDSTSLDYRLRDASNLRTTVISLLENLIQLLEDIDPMDNGRMAIGAKQAQTEEFDEDDAGLFNDHEGTTTLNSAFQEVQEMNNCLLRFSRTLNNPARHDYLKQQILDYPRFENIDIEYVRNKFPSAQPYLQVRLGKAIAKHRHYIRYRQQHQQKSAKDIDNNASDTPLLAQKGAVVAAVNNPTIIDRRQRETKQTIPTSFAPTSTDELMLVRPSAPSGSQSEKPFECPICFGFVIVESEQSWRQHVFEDMPPYYCTYEECRTGDTGYSNESKWRSHLITHKSYWICPFCDRDINLEADFMDHMIHTHKYDEAGSALAHIVAACSVLDDTVPDLRCPLCDDLATSMELWFKHIGRHMEELALHSLSQEHVSPKD